jgi:hypothetical protein
MSQLREHVSQRRQSARCVCFQLLAVIPAPLIQVDVVVTGSLCSPSSHTAPVTLSTFLITTSLVTDH